MRLMVFTFIYVLSNREYIILLAIIILYIRRVADCSRNPIERSVDIGSCSHFLDSCRIKATAAQIRTILSWNMIVFPSGRSFVVNWKIFSMGIFLFFFFSNLLYLKKSWGLSIILLQLDVKKQIFSVKILNFYKGSNSGPLSSCPYAIWSFWIILTSQAFV